MNQDILKKTSKYLSYILRHNPSSIGLSLDTHGWAYIDELIEKSKDMDLDRALLEEVVDTNAKKRFAIDGDKIRANQGHSIDIDLELKPIVPPNKLYHGTATRFLDSIMRDGLTKQARHHVHLSDNIDTAINVGKRHGKVAILELDAKKMDEEGFIFYCSNNGVWLTDSVPVRFLKIVEN